jgi:hypothetical protein
MVHHAGRAQALALALLASVVLGGCLGGGSGEVSPSTGAIGGSIRTADCAGWRTAGPSARAATIRDIRGFAGGPVGEADRDGATLPNDKAYDLFDGACSRDFAKRFKLYKLYTRAAAFQKHIPTAR